MAEEKTDEKQAEKKEEVVEPTPDETKAMSLGWKPKDQWEGDPEEWIPAKQFNKNGELFGRINSYKNKITHLEKSVDALVKHNEKVFDAGYKAAEASLKAERRVALQEGNHEVVDQIEEKLEELKTEHTKQKTDFVQEVKSTAPAQHPSWEPWVNQNTWYGQDRAMRGYADGVAQDIVQEAKEAGHTIDFDKLLTEVGRKTQEKFPEKFGRSGMSTNTTIKDDSREGGGGSRKAKKDDVESQMTSAEKEMMEVILRSGVKKEKYLEDYKKVQSRGR